MIKFKPLVLILSLAGLGLFNSCVPLAAGAAGGYFLHKEGYRVQTPVKKVDVKSQAPTGEEVPAAEYPDYSGYPQTY